MNQGLKDFEQIEQHMWGERAIEVGELKGLWSEGGIRDMWGAREGYRSRSP